MTTGSWDPDSKKSASNITVDGELLRRLLTIAEGPDLMQLETQMSEQDQKQNAIMQADLTAWQSALGDYSDEQLIALIRFFTLVEMKLGHWVGGAKSPVIYINKILRSRGSKLDKEMLLWIKQHSDNRFIPNGSPF